jgi:hypothetical protein
MAIDPLVSRVTVLGIFAIAAVTASAAWLWGVAGAAGTIGAGAIALLNFRWLARGAARALAGGGPRGALVGLGLRYLATLGALALLLSSGWAHPVAVVAGIAVLPLVLIVEGLRVTRS